MKYMFNDVEVEKIETGDWPEGISLIASNGGFDFTIYEGVVCLRLGVAFLAIGCTSRPHSFWAVLPPKPAVPKEERLSNRQFGALLNQGYDILTEEGLVVYNAHSTCLDSEEDSPCPDLVKAVRAPKTGTWLEPTTGRL